jgi:DNA-binding transcriptional regulator YiaG
MTRYHYTESGLNNVWIESATFERDDSGEDTICIPAINDLHRVIAEGIVGKSGMTGAELRFLRSEMGMSQAELGEILHKERLTVGRWERGENPIDENAETVIRLVAIERLNLTFPTVEDVAARSVPSAKEQTITIDASDPEKYRLAA